MKAKKFLAGMMLNKTVEIKGYGLGLYNRILGVLYVNSNNVNIELIKAGLAEVYRGNPPRGFDLMPYSQAESEAKKDKRGIWSLGVKYISPKDWRKRNKYLNSKVHHLFSHM